MMKKSKVKTKTGPQHPNVYTTASLEIETITAVNFFTVISRRPTDQPLNLSTSQPLNLSLNAPAPA
jgi:hypothetical protein